MTDKANAQKTVWSNKPVKMKLFGAWEIDKTPPDCIPRLCSLNITRLTLNKSFRSDITALIVAVKMQNSKRTLRSNEINIPLHESDHLNSTLDIELDLTFTLQYPHFIKRSCNYLQIILHRRKKYKNKAILGYKTLACGLIDMAEVLQRSTIVEKNLDLMNHDKESSKTGTVARITISSLKSQPVDQDGNLRRGKFSIDRPDVYSDEDEFTSAEDGSDSETIEEGNVVRLRRKLMSSKSRKLFSNNEKFHTGVPANVQQRNLKQKFISLLKKFRMPDSEAYDSEEKFQAALEKELMSSTQEPADIDEFFDDEEIDDLDDLSDSGQEFDDNVSISSTPKPSLRPFFSSSTLIGQDKSDDFPSIESKRDSQENSGTENNFDVSNDLVIQSKYINVEESKKKAANKETKRARFFPKEKDKKKALSNVLSLNSSTAHSKEDTVPKEFLHEQLNKVFSTDEQTMPDEIIFINLSESNSHLLQLFERTHHIIGTTTLADIKFAFIFLCNRIQRLCNSNLKTVFPIKIALIGSDSYVNLFLRFYVETLSTKPPDWQNFLRFYVIPWANVSSMFHKYLASIDATYSNYFCTVNKDLESGRGETNIVEQDFYNKIVNFLKNAQTLIQVPIAEAMVTYKDKNVDDESIQVFIPFICNVKIGLADMLNHSADDEYAHTVSSPSASSVLIQGSSAVSSNEKNIKGNDKDHATTPPNSPNITSNQSFSQINKDFANQNEAFDLQIDYWTVQPKFADTSQKKNDNCKFTLKNSFRNMQISRLPIHGEISSSLAILYVTKEKKQKIMRLGKKKEKDMESKCQVLEGISRLVCSYKASQSPIKVTIDGVELSGVKFFQLTPHWQTQIKFFPVVVFSSQDNLVGVNQLSSSSTNNFKK